MFNHRALEPRCGALRPGALQLGGAQTGYRVLYCSVKVKFRNRQEKRLLQVQRRNKVGKYVH